MEKFIGLFLLLMAISLSQASPLNTTQQENNSSLTNTEHDLSSSRNLQQLIQHAKKNIILGDRIAYLSYQFMGRHYTFGPLGEGSQGRYDQQPRFRLDTFDCQTYVETVLALSFASNTKQFHDYLQKLRYDAGNISFLQRNHFPSSDWIPHNQAQGFIKNINRQIAPKAVSFINAYIDKKNWLKHITTKRLHLDNSDANVLRQRLSQLHQMSQLSHNESVRLAYIKLSTLFSKSQRQRYYPMFARIPSGAIIFIIRQHWRPRGVGSNMLVSHMGFAIWRNGQLFLRHASPTHAQVTDVPLMAYLRRYYRSHYTKVVGISVYMPQTPGPQAITLQKFLKNKYMT